MKTITVVYHNEKSNGQYRLILRFALKGIVVMLIVGISAFMVVRFWLSRSSTATGTPPAGYSSMNQIYLAILTGALPLIDRQPSVPPELQLDEGITYSKSGDMELKLDLYRPRTAGRAQRRPLFVLIHGGGWKSGRREDYRPHALRVASAGYVVASLSYRLSGVAKFPAAVRDVNSAIQFLADHADDYGIDPNRVVLMGGSAGGHLAMLAGYSKDPMFLPESNGSTGVRYKILAIFNFYGPCDLTSDFARNVDVVRGFLGAEYQSNSEIYKKASPLFDISPDDPATLIVHGTLDDIVPVDQSDQLAKKLKESSVPFRYERINGWPHTMDIAEPMFEYLSQVILEELRRVVGRAADTEN